MFLHGRDLVVQRAEARAGGKTYAGSWHQADPSGVAVLTFAETLPAGPVTFSFTHEAAFNDGPAGLFRVKVGEDWYSWSQFQSTDARAAYPGFDDPGFKTPFAVTIRTPPGLVAVSNAPQVSTTREAGLDVHRFAPTLPLPTYLVAVMAGPFTVLEGTVPPSPQRAKPLPLRIISTRENTGKLAFALESSKQIVTLLEDYFADAFPYPKLDQITTPILPGAMENPGADLYGTQILVVDEQAPTPQKRSFGMIVSHELGHQWFGDLVTPQWWDDIWLNESFANWMGYRIGHAWRPDLNIGAGALSEGYDAMATDALNAGRPIRQTISRNDQIDAAFDEITYGKGGHVVAMIAAFMGDEKFRDGVRRYMAKHRYGNATSANFFQALADAAGDPRIVPALQSFTDQQGVPLLTLVRKGKGYAITQERYGSVGTIVSPARWGVPVCLRRGANRQCSLMTQDRMTVQIDGDGPIMPNADGTGYYRFELPRNDWNALILAAPGLSGGEAQAVADSLAASVQAGRASGDQLMRLAQLLSRHPDSYAAEAAVIPLARMAGTSMLDTKAQRSVRRFMARTYTPLLAAYGLDPRLGAYSHEDPEKSQRRYQIVLRMMNGARDRAIAQTLAQAARQFLGGDSKALDPAWFAPAFQAYVSENGTEAAKGLIAKALAPEGEAFRLVAFDIVSGSGKEEIARWLLEDFKDERLRGSERRNLVRGVLQSASTRRYGYAWLLANIDKLTSGSGSIFFAARMPQWLSNFCSVEQADAFARDLRPSFAGKQGALELERVIERVRNCGLASDLVGRQISGDLAKFK